jgi:uncharacterized membrane protein
MLNAYYIVFAVYITCFISYFASGVIWAAKGRQTGFLAYFALASGILTVALYVGLRIIEQRAH